MQRKKGATLASGSFLPVLTSGTEYTARVVVGSDGSGGQKLKITIDSDRDGDFADETTLLNTDSIDNDWSTGYVGLFRAQNDTTAHQFDNFKVGYDNNVDGDVDDAGDDVQIDDNFDSGAITQERPKGALNYLHTVIATGAVTLKVFPAVSRVIQRFPSFVCALPICWTTVLVFCLSAAGCRHGSISNEGKASMDETAIKIGDDAAVMQQKRIIVTQSARNGAYVMTNMLSGNVQRVEDFAVRRAEYFDSLDALAARLADLPASTPVHAGCLNEYDPGSHLIRELTREEIEYLRHRCREPQQPPNLAP